VGGARFHDVDFEGYVDTVPYGCWRKSTFEKLGLFDEELARNQDDEFNLRLIQAGGKIWQSTKIKSWYYPRASFKSLFRQYLQYGYWKVRVIQKHRIAASWRHLVPGGFVLAVLLCAIFSPFSGVARWFFFCLCALYLSANIAASLVICNKPENWRFLIVMPFVLAAYHLGYGTGFLIGLFDFTLFKGRGRKSLSAITR
jgi:GT2 family glycosyltransferase